jgi:hypothetical protein
MPQENTNGTARLNIEKPHSKGVIAQPPFPNLMRRVPQATRSMPP